MTKQLLYLLWFELKNAYLRPDGVWGGMLYFLLTLMIMPFTLKITDANITNLAPTMIWVAIIPAILTASNRIFSDDIHDGFIDRFVLMNISVSFVFIIKIMVIYIFIIIPSLCTLPILSILFHIPVDITYRLFWGLLCCLPAIAFFTGFGTLLSLHGKVGHILTFLIVIPLIIPAIILGAGIVYTSAPLSVALKLPIIFSLISVLVTVPASHFLYLELYADR
jgi:heme exporter protein B